MINNKKKRNFTPHKKLENTMVIQSNSDKPVRYSLLADEARGADAMASDMVTVSSIAAVALLAAVLAIEGSRTGHITQGLVPACLTATLPTVGIAAATHMLSYTTSATLSF